MTAVPTRTRSAVGSSTLPRWTPGASAGPRSRRPSRWRRARPAAPAAAVWRWAPKSNQTNSGMQASRTMVMTLGTVRMRSTPTSSPSGGAGGVLRQRWASGRVRVGPAPRSRADPPPGRAAPPRPVPACAGHAPVAPASRGELPAPDAVTHGLRLEVSRIRGPLLLGSHHGDRRSLMATACTNISLSAFEWRSLRGTGCGCRPTGPHRAGSPRSRRGRTHSSWSSRMRPSRTTSRPLAPGAAGRVTARNEQPELLVVAERAWRDPGRSATSPIRRSTASSVPAASLVTGLTGPRGGRRPRGPRALGHRLVGHRPPAPSSTALLLGNRSMQCAGAVPAP